MYTIVVDAGHGGTEAGGGSLGETEKSITLRHALALVQVLAIRGYRAVPVRVFDESVPLIDRATLANNVRADLFVSIHANAGPRESTGALTLYADGSRRGRVLAGNIQGEIVKVYGGAPTSYFPDVKPYTNYATGVAVLRRTKMPAALVELDFMTNPRDIAELMDNRRTMLAARAIADGIGLACEALFPR